MPDSIPDDLGFTVVYLRCALAVVHASFTRDSSGDPRRTHDHAQGMSLDDRAHEFALAATCSELQTTVSIDDAHRLRRMLGRFIDHEFASAPIAARSIVV